jgi:hypothetical protein
MINLESVEFGIKTSGCEIGARCVLLCRKNLPLGTGEVFAFACVQRGTG